MSIMAAQAGETRSGRPPQPFVIRVAHWAAIPLLVIMAGSGLQIFTAYPMLGPSGDLYGWYPWQGVPPPRWLRFGNWLAGARHWHFAVAWFLVANGAMYLLYMGVRGEWRRRLFNPRRDTANALLMIAYYLRIRRTPPPVDFYNGLQRLAYTSAIALGLVEVLSGLAIYKPVQFSWLAALFGGYDGARAAHLLGLVGLAMFAVVHIILVSLHPRALVDMITGGKRAS
jgi:thiosulfate reductase cytochrome b subunit